MRNDANPRTPHDEMPPHQEISLFFLVSHRDLADKTYKRKRCRRG